MVNKTHAVGKRISGILCEKVLATQRKKGFCPLSCVPVVTVIPLIFVM